MSQLPLWAQRGPLQYYEGSLRTHTLCLGKRERVPLRGLWVLWGAMANTLTLGQEPWVWVLTLLLFRGEP